MTAIAKTDNASIIESAIVHGDLSRLGPGERTAYYMRVCESVGLNPLTKPFEYLRLNGRETLYATRTCTDQLRQIHGVSVRITARENVGDVYVVTASATDKNGRTDESTGAVVIGSLKGENLANALMKAETKAKRRVTLSICGLGMLDESELDTISPAAMAPAGSAIDAAYIDERAEAQARQKNIDGKYADELIAMLPDIATADDFATWCYHHGYEIIRLESNAKGRLWRAMQKRIDAAGIKVSAQEVKDLMAAAPAPMPEGIDD